MCEFNFYTLQNRIINNLTTSQVLERDIKHIVQECLKLTPDLYAIILYGSYGRNEGGWYKDRLGFWKPYNDYDICIVVETKVSTYKIKKVEKELVEKLPIRWIDLGQKTYKELINLSPSILNYDFKNGSTIIAGDKDILTNIPNISSETLPIKECLTLYFTRIFTLIGSFKKNGLQLDLSGEDSRFFRNQMAKSVLAVIDVLLLAKGGYDSSYVIRLKRVLKFYPDNITLQELGNWALQEKLSPQSPDMSAVAVQLLYEKVLTFFENEMNKALSLCFNHDIRSPVDIEYCIKRKPVALLKRLFWFILHGRVVENQMYVQLAQSYLIAAWSPNMIDHHHLGRAIKLLKKVDNKDVSTWDDARLLAAQLRMEVN